MSFRIKRNWNPGQCLEFNNFPIRLYTFGYRYLANPDQFTKLFKTMNYDQAEKSID